MALATASPVLPARRHLYLVDEATVLRPTVYHLTRRGRLVRTVAIALALAAGLFFVAGNRAVASSAPQVKIVTVAPGQSLWQLAEELAPTADPRDVIYQIRALNGLQTSALSAGQQLVVPNLP